MASKPVLQGTVTYSGTIAVKRFAGYGATPTLAAAGAASIGVIESWDAATGKALITKLGEAEVDFAGVVAIGGLVEVGTDGKAVAKSSGVAVGYLSHSNSSATVNGSTATVTLLPNS